MELNILRIQSGLICGNILDINWICEFTSIVDRLDRLDLASQCES